MCEVDTITIYRWAETYHRTCNHERVTLKLGCLLIYSEIGIMKLETSVQKYRVPRWVVQQIVIQLLIARHNAFA